MVIGETSNKPKREKKQTCKDFIKYFIEKYKTAYPNIPELVVRWAVDGVKINIVIKWLKTTHNDKTNETMFKLIDYFFTNWNMLCTKYKWGGLPNIGSFVYFREKIYQDMFGLGQDSNLRNRYNKQNTENAKEVGW